MACNTKKNHILNVFCWTFPNVRIILCALFASISLSAAESGEENISNKKMQSTDRETVVKLEKELNAVRRKAEKDLAEMRREMNLLKEENKVIRKELLETLDKFSMQAEKLKRYEMSASAVIESMNPIYVGSREEESAESLRTVMQSSAALASATASFCDEVLILLQKSSLDPVLSAKLRLRVNSLRDEVRNTAILNMIPPSPHGFASCRVLNLDEKLNAVVLSAGYRNGVRTGMLLRSSDGTIVMQVVALKNFTCAALVTKGEIKKIGIGMEAFVTGKVVGN